MELKSPSAKANILLVVFKSHLYGIEIARAARVARRAALRFKSHLYGIEINMLRTRQSLAFTFKSHLYGIEIVQQTVVPSWCKV